MIARENDDDSVCGVRVELTSPARAVIVVPAYNEAARLPVLLAQIKDYIGSGVPAAHDLDVRFLLVDDGSRPDEAARERTLLDQAGIGERMTFVRFEQNRGKGAAIRSGFELGLHDGCTYVGFVDSDSAISIADVHRALVYMSTAGAEPALAGVIGSRIRMLGRRVERSPLRHYAGRVFATIVGLYFNCDAYDTQCGLKIFRAAAVEPYIHVPVDDRWIWDTQLLLAMLDAGEVIHELPIDWHEPGGSKVSIVRDSAQMVFGLVKFKHHLRMAMPNRRSWRSVP